MNANMDKQRENFKAKLDQIKNLQKKQGAGKEEAKESNNKQTPKMNLKVVQSDQIEDEEWEINEEVNQTNEIPDFQVKSKNNKQKDELKKKQQELLINVAKPYLVAQKDSLMHTRDFRMEAFLERVLLDDR